MDFSYHRIANKQIYDLCASNWPVVAQQHRLERAPPWPTTLLEKVSLNQIAPRSEMTKDVDGQTFDDFTTQLSGLKYGLCVTNQNNEFRAYAAVASKTLHAPREQELKDYRLGPVARGIITQLSIALLPAEEKDAEKLNDRRASSFKEVTRSWVGSLREVLTFGKNSTELPTSVEEGSQQVASAAELELVKTAKCVHDKLGKRKLLLVYPGMHMSVAGQRVIVTDMILDNALESSVDGCGFTTGATVVTPNLADPGEFDRIQVCPFLDTIPQTYELDVFTDALRPFFAKNPLRTFAEGDTFKYNSVEFKIVGTKPTSLPPRISLDRALGMSLEELIGSIAPNRRKQRVGPSTVVCLGYAILPHWIDILSAERQHIVMSLPAPIQSIMLINYVSESGGAEIERVMMATEAKVRPTVSAAKRAKDLADAMQKLKVNVSHTMEEDGVCVVCLGEITPTDEVVRLECSHIFHLTCLSNWLVRTKTCPLCKAQLTDINLPQPAS